MGICFIGKKNFSNFIKKYINNNPGDICDENGLLLGKHNGLFNYTLGQRKGIKIGGHKDYDEKPWFVIRKDNLKNILVISQNEEKLLSSRLINLRNITWIKEKPKENKGYYYKRNIGIEILIILFKINYKQQYTNSK